MSTCEIAITTWNRRDEVCRTIDSALAQGVDGLIVSVYDNASTDGTVELLSEKYGDRIRLHPWPENRGRHANMTRALQNSAADYLMMVFDDEELEAGAVGKLMSALESNPGAAFAFGRATQRNFDGTVIKANMLMAPDSFRPPVSQPGLDWIRSIFEMGDYTWICAVMFSLERVGSPMVTERDAPCDDSGLLMRSALTGDVMFVDAAVTTKTDGNDGESVREGLVVEQDGAIGHGFTLEGLMGYRRVYERFLLTDGRKAFSRSEQKHLLGRIELVMAGLVGDEAALVYRSGGFEPARNWIRQSMVWIHSPRSWIRIGRRVAQGVRSTHA